MRAVLRFTGTYPSGPDYVRLPGGRPNFAKSAARALEVLDVFAADQRPLRAIDIGSVLELQSSSADQLLKTMVDAGYLVFDEVRKVYFPSLRLSAFAGWFGAASGANALEATLEALQPLPDETASVSVRQGNDMQFAFVLPRTDQPEIVVPGLRVPLINSAAGYAVLTEYSDAEISRIVARARRYRRDKQILLADVTAGVWQARKAGYAYFVIAAAKRTTISKPIATPSSEFHAAISLSAPEDRAERDRDEIASRLTCAIRAGQLRAP